MKDLNVATVYISPSGSDDNDGLSAAESVETFDRAIEIGQSIPSNGIIHIHAEGGTYLAKLRYMTVFDLLLILLET